MNNPGVESAVAAAQAIGGRVALPGLDCKADIWDLWDKHGPEITSERILAAKNPSAKTTPAISQDQLPAGFRLSERGLFFTQPGEDKDGNPNPPIWIGPPLRILARTRDGQSEAWGLLLEWEDPDGNTHRVAIPYSMLLEPRQVLALLAAGGYIGAPGKQARAMFSQLLATVAPARRARCVPRTGWHYECFVLPDQSFGTYPEMLVLQAAGAENPYRQAGDLEAWKQTLGKWCCGNSRLLFSVSASLAGPLLALVGMDSGAIHFYGHSSCGKTTLIRVGWSVWGGPEGLRTWRATTNGLEGVASVHTDTLLVLDEVGQADPKALGEASYLLMNGCGKVRADVDGSAKSSRRWTIMVLSSGEPTLTDRLAEAGQKPRAGQEVRLVDVPADAGQDWGAWENLHGQSSAAQFSDLIKSSCAEYHGTLGRAWLDLLANHQEKVRELRAVTRKTAERWAAGAESGQVVRVAERFALIGLAGELAAQNGLAPWPEGECLRAAKKCLDAWLLARGGTGDSEDMQALATIRGYVATYGASRFQEIGMGADDTITVGANVRILERAGFRRTMNGQEHFIFTKEQWAEIFRGRNPQQAARALDRAGLMVRNDARNLTQKVSLPDLGRVRAYVVRIALWTEEAAP